MTSLGSGDKGSRPQNDESSGDESDRFVIVVQPELSSSDQQNDTSAAVSASISVTDHTSTISVSQLHNIMNLTTDSLVLDSASTGNERCANTQDGQVSHIVCSTSHVTLNNKLLLQNLDPLSQSSVSTCDGSTTCYTGGMMLQSPACGTSAAQMQDQLLVQQQPQLEQQELVAQPQQGFLPAMSQQPVRGVYVPSPPSSAPSPFASQSAHQVYPGGLMLHAVEGHWSSSFATQASTDQQQLHATALQVQTAGTATVLNQQTVQSTVTPVQQQQQQAADGLLQDCTNVESSHVQIQSGNDCNNGISVISTSAYNAHQQHQQFIWTSTGQSNPTATVISNQQLQYMQQPQQQIQLQQQQVLFQNMMVPASLLQASSPHVNQQMIYHQQQQQLQTEQQPSSAGNGKAQDSSCSYTGNVSTTGCSSATSGVYPAAAVAGGIGKGMATVLPQQQQLSSSCTGASYGSRQMMQQRPVSGPVMYNHMGMMQNNHQQQQQPQQNSIQQLQQQQQLRPAQQLALNIGSIGGAQLFTASNAQIRFAAAPNFITNTGQIIAAAAAGNQTLLSMGPFQMPILQPAMLSNPAFLGSQPVYIQTQDGFTAQQQPITMIGNVQSVTPVKNIANIAPQTAARSASVQPRRLHVLPNNSSNNSLLSTTKQNKTNSKVRPLAKTPPSQSVLARASHASSTATLSNQKVPTVVVAPSVARCTASGTDTSPSVMMSIVNTTSTALVTSCLTESLASVTESSCKTTATTTTTSTCALVCPVKDERVNEVKKSSECTDNSSTSHSNPLSCQALTTAHKSKITPKKSRPKILTHIIEGFIIQEATEPFPMNRRTLMSQFLSSDVALPSELLSREMSEVTDQITERSLHDSLQNANTADDVEAGVVVSTETESCVEVKSVNSTSTVYDDGIPRLVCEFCGRLDIVSNFARSRRFCSVTCSKRYSAYSQRKASTAAGLSGVVSKPVAKRSQPAVSTAQLSVLAPLNKLSKTSMAPCSKALTVEVTSDVVAQPSLSGAEPSVQLERMEGEDESPPSNKPLAEWGVEEVYEFVRRLAGCESYAEEFRVQEIDGQALTLLKEDHLMMTLNVKLGPALKICQRINALKQ